MKYSVITPVYNSFEHMEQYFNAFCRQQFNSFELVIVDDCSIDHSFENLIAYQKSSPLNIQIIQMKKNGGPGAARNEGMRHASGEWITFVDSDDWVSDTFFQDIDRIIKENEVNCVVFDYLKTTDKKRHIFSSIYGGKEGNYSAEQCIALIRNHTFGKVYKAACCDQKGIEFPSIRRCEDVAFVAQAIDACGSVFYYKKPLYFYRQRKNSLSHDQQMGEYEMVAAFKILEERLGNKYPKQISEKSVTDLLYGGVLLMCKAQKGGKEIRGFISDYNRKHKDWYQFEVISSMGRAKRIFMFAIKNNCIFLIKILTYAHGWIA